MSVTHPDSMWNLRSLAECVLDAPQDRGINVGLARDLAREALASADTLRSIAHKANQLAEDGLMPQGTGCQIRDKALAALSARGDEAIKIIRGDYE